MGEFRRKIELLVRALNEVEGVSCLMPGGTFYVFPSVAAICNRYKITSHGLAMYMLEYADEHKGLACLGGECFGEAGGGFLRLSCSEPDERLSEAIEFLADAVQRRDRIDAYVDLHDEFRLTASYES
jgi:aspartate aminotransferase